MLLKSDKPCSSWIYTSFSNKNGLKIATADATIISIRYFTEYWVMIIQSEQQDNMGIRVHF